MITATIVIATTAFMILMVSSFTNVLALYPLTLTSDRLLASLLGGAMVAIGVGVAFRLNTTTGGIDIIIKVLRKRYRHIKTGSLYFIFDFFIVLLSWLVFGNLEAAAYAMISVVVSSYITSLFSKIFSYIFFTLEINIDGLKDFPEESDIG